MRYWRASSSLGRQSYCRTSAETTTARLRTPSWLSSQRTPNNLPTSSRSSRRPARIPDQGQHRQERENGRNPAAMTITSGASTRRRISVGWEHPPLPSSRPRPGFRSAPVSPALALGGTGLPGADAAGARPGNPGRLQLPRPRGRLGLVGEAAAGDDPVAGQDAVGRRGQPVFAVEPALLQALDHPLGILLVVRAQHGGGPEHAGGGGGGRGRPPPPPRGGRGGAPPAVVPTPARARGEPAADVARAPAAAGWCPCPPSVPARAMPETAATA